MDLFTLISRMQTDGTIERIVRDPLAQFGPEPRQYLGAQILPEREVPENAFTEDSIRYRTVIANDGSRYSPAQLKADSAIVGQFLVVLGNQDIARQFTGRDYDAFLALLDGPRPEMTAVPRLIDWLDVTVNRAMIELNEKQRWDAILNAAVVRRGDNGYVETVTFPNPSGHRAAAGGQWSNDAYDPYPDIIAMAQKLWDKGYTISRMVTSRKVIGILSNNDKMIARTQGRLFVQGDGTLSQQNPGRTNLAAINAALMADGLPAFQTYDHTYYTLSATYRFMPDTVVAMFAETGRDETVTELNFSQSGQFDVIPNTLGYHAVGRAVGQPRPGRVIRMWPRDNKPPRIDAEGWQTSFPVITEPEALAVITGIS